MGGKYVHKFKNEAKSGDLVYINIIRKEASEQLIYNINRNI